MVFEKSFSYSNFSFLKKLLKMSFYGPAYRNFTEIFLKLHSKQIFMDLHTEK